MGVYLLRRLFTFAVTLLAASVLVFVVLDVLPGNAAQVLLGPDAAPEAVAALERRLGLDRPAVARYADWLAGLARGDLGLSHAYGTPVATLIAERIAVTVPLALLALVLTVVLALAAGATAALHHGRAADTAIMAATQLGVAVPNFWLAILLVLLFSVVLQWLPAGGFPGWGGGAAAALQALLLPAVALAAVQAAILARVTRAALLEVLGEDYVRTARAKGLSRRAALWRHALRNALVPVLTVFGLQVSSLLAGTIVIENVFTLPGLGRLMFQSIMNRDLVVVRNGAMLLAAIVVGVNLAVDLLMVAVDPRIRLQRT